MIEIVQLIVLAVVVTATGAIWWAVDDLRQSAADTSKRLETIEADGIAIHDKVSAKARIPEGEAVETAFVCGHCKIYTTGVATLFSDNSPLTSWVEIKCDVCAMPTVHENQQLMQHLMLKRQYHLMDEEVT